MNNIRKLSLPAISSLTTQVAEDHVAPEIGNNVVSLTDLRAQKEQALALDITNIAAIT